MSKLNKITLAILFAVAITFANDSMKVDSFAPDTSINKIEFDMQKYQSMHKVSEVTKLVSIGSMVLGGLIMNHSENEPIGAGMMIAGGMGYFLGFTIEFAYTDKLKLNIK